jgi:hypothetical protein
MSTRPTLAEPIMVSRFWRNRKGEAVFVQLRPFEGRALVDLRIHYTDKAGKMAPTEKGLSIVVARLPELAAAINKAVRTAQGLGLLPPEAQS